MKREWQREISCPFFFSSTPTSTDPTTTATKLFYHFDIIIQRPTRRNLIAFPFFIVAFYFHISVPFFTVAERDWRENSGGVSKKRGEEKTDVYLREGFHSRRLFCFIKDKTTHARSFCTLLCHCRRGERERENIEYRERERERESERPKRKKTKKRSERVVLSLPPISTKKPTSFFLR